MANKIYIKFFKIPLVKIKKTGAEYKVYFLFVPLFNICKKGKSYCVNLIVFNKICRLLSGALLAIKNNASKENIKKRFRAGDVIKICLLDARPGMWCFDYLFDLLNKDPRFEPSIVVMPDNKYSTEFQRMYLNETYNELRNKGYNPNKGIDFDNKKILDLRKQIKPDIMFYTDFWKPHFYDEFYITNFLDKINLLHEYGFSVMQDEKTCAFELNNLADLYFRPTDIHKKMAQNLMKNHGENVVVTGSAKLDAIFDKNYVPRDMWKKQPVNKKKLIWAPHYTDNMPLNMYRNDAFWEISDFMLDIAKKYEDKIQWVFRPHPLLKERMAQKLGIERQKEYYAKWDELNNTQYCGGDFIDLFATSDAMIMDSCSFRAEYTAFDKPLFLTITKTSRLKYNEFGEKLNELFYKPELELKSGIIDFIENVVLNGKDSMAEKRHDFVKKYFSKINNRTASENIYHEIVNFLEGEKK